MMNDSGKSDRTVVPEKPPNKADSHAAEVVEERDRAKGNSSKRDKPWTLSQPGLPSALERVGQAARREPERKPSGSIRTARTRRLPGKTCSACLYREGGRAEKTARCSSAGRQNRSALRRRGIERDLRGGLPGVFLRIPAKAEPASSAGRCGIWNVEEAGEMGA